MFNGNRNSFSFPCIGLQHYCTNKSKFSYYTAREILLLSPCCTGKLFKTCLFLKGDQTVHKYFPKSENILVGINFLIYVNVLITCSFDKLEIKIEWNFGMGIWIEINESSVVSKISTPRFYAYETSRIDIF